MNAASIPSLHRLLDEAFAGIPMNPEVQDLKEEIRGNLSARVDELVVGGADERTAVTTAITELGPISDLVDSLGTPGGAAVSAHTLNRVRYSPAFVVAVTALSLLLVAAVALVAIAAFRLLPLGAGLIAAGVGTLAVALIVFSALRQETSQHYPLPTGRALGFGVASGVGFAGLALVALYVAADASGISLLIAGIVLAVASLMAFIWLGVTQTNRTKPWALELQRSYEANDPFSKNPALAARFGLYTVVIWTLAIAAFVALSILVGFVWSWLALVGGFVVFFLVLARMMFGAKAD